MNETKLPPIKESDFLQTACIKHSENPMGEILYLDMVGFDHEKKLQPGEIQEVSLRKFSKVFSLEPYQVQAEIDPIMSKQVEDLHGISMKEQMISVLLNEDQMSREKMLYKKYVELAEKSRGSLLTPWQKKVSKYFKRLTFHRYVLTGEDIMRQIILHANMIGVKSRRGQGNFVVVAAEVLAMLEDSPAFTWKPSNSSISLGIPTFEEVGHFYGIRVFRNAMARFNDRSIIVGRVTKNNEAGVYMVQGKRECIEMQDTMTLKTKICIRSRMSAVDTINADTNFQAFEIEIGKKPWWKKLFKL
jgi:hypothetical protein